MHRQGSHLNDIKMGISCVNLDMRQAGAKGHSVLAQCLTLKAHPCSSRCCLFTQHEGSLVGVSWRQRLFWPLWSGRRTP